MPPEATTETQQTQTPSGSETKTNESTLSAGLSATTPKEPTKPEGSDPNASADKPAEAKASGAPEKYEAWSVPDGYELDQGLVDEASPIFKELGLSQEASQKLVDFYAKHALATNKEVMDAWTATRTEWRESMKTDPDLGKLVGKDGNFGPDSPLIQTVNRALDGLQNPKLVSDFKAAMDLTGAGDNPAFVRVLHALASKVTEGTSYAKGDPAKASVDPRTGQLREGRPSAAAAIYPNLPSAGG